MGETADRVMTQIVGDAIIVRFRGILPPAERHMIKDQQGESLIKELKVKLKEISLALYKRASKYAESQGVIIADTKFEFGWLEEELILIDEILTPDSSRFWPKDTYEPGKLQPSFDKQFVRDYLETLDWNKKSPGPELPDEIVNETTQKYLQALKMITGWKL